MTLQLAEFIYEQPAAGDIEYIFKHALTQEVAYNSVLIERRKPLHERIGAAIEALALQPDRRSSAELLTTTVAASNSKKTVDYLDRAARQASARAPFTESRTLSVAGDPSLARRRDVRSATARNCSCRYALRVCSHYAAALSTGETRMRRWRLLELAEDEWQPGATHRVCGLGCRPRGAANGREQQIAIEMLEIATNA